ncbi:helix-turn-helix domain-containing protein [Massilia sp. TW-1]|uniref:Helix-turn-helix domain-containing protein n=1 Tax=Telluria antibiotica TaxID=2717319 RepID=A0ABX0P505_9BURK|nr:helix-turn-helix domain-containing protein [Telluria antibiotica]NIA52291.1 helix-turn-helix domain-containing protein [Telluria antibiotica]
MDSTIEYGRDSGNPAIHQDSRWAWAEDQRPCGVSAADVYLALQERDPCETPGCLPGLRRVHFECGQRLFEIGQAFHTLAIVRLGFLKTFAVNDGASEQVLGFPMRGSILGIDGIDSGRHQSCTQALSSGELILIPYVALLNLARTHPDLYARIFSAISAELESNLSMVRLLALRFAEARIARFLMLLASRHAALGYSDSKFMLRMRRCDIGSLLGVTPETVCRTLTTLHSLGIIEVRHHNLRIVDRHALSTVERLPASPARLKQIEANRVRRRLLRNCHETGVHPLSGASAEVAPC